MNAPANSHQLSEKFDIESLWTRANFHPNDHQRQAIRHVDGPLYLPAGPGSGKTRVLLWRTINLVLCHGVPPERIFLSTFTEKAAQQLKEGLHQLFEQAGEHPDLSAMYVGTVHSLCRRLLLEPRSPSPAARPKAPETMDELGQYLFVSTANVWNKLTGASGLDVGPSEINRRINEFFNKQSASRQIAAENAVALFNRLSEECIVPANEIPHAADEMRVLLRMYQKYLDLLREHNKADFSLLQQEGWRAVETSQLFDHVIVDEYQDTNTIQEKLFFRLAGKKKNLCVVGDDDQSLYRFRGARVENFVEFPRRCKDALDVEPTEIKLLTNYRSRKQIVDFYGDFIKRHEWQTDAPGTQLSHRVAKNIEAYRRDPQGASPAVVVSRGTRDDVSRELAALTRDLLKEQRVEDASQIAFLFPSLTTKPVRALRAALKEVGLSVYAPRAGRFLDTAESRDILGIYAHILNATTNDQANGRDFAEFQTWLGSARERGQELRDHDHSLDEFVLARQKELEALRHDHPGRRATDWGLLDLFWRLTEFAHFKRAFEQAETGQDEAPICNLGLLSQYIARFSDHYSLPVITGRRLQGAGSLGRTFFNSYLYALFRRAESEYEDVKQAFPAGYVPFLTIHQAKGLEFPVVILGNPRRSERVSPIETLVHPHLQSPGEPLERQPGFDNMRLFYVALSRAQNLLVSAEYPRAPALFSATLEPVPTLSEFDVGNLPPAPHEQAELSKTYSYTGDYMAYRQCPRQYMLFRKYGLVPARPQAMVFGSLVHRTLEDLHRFLIARSEKNDGTE